MQAPWGFPAGAGPVWVIAFSFFFCLKVVEKIITNDWKLRIPRVLVIYTSSANWALWWDINRRFTLTNDTILCEYTSESQFLRIALVLLALSAFGSSTCMQKPFRPSCRSQLMPVISFLVKTEATLKDTFTTRKDCTGYGLLCFSCSLLRKFFAPCAGSKYAKFTTPCLFFWEPRGDCSCQLSFEKAVLDFAVKQACPQVHVYKWRCMCVRVCGCMRLCMCL